MRAPADRLRPGHLQRRSIARSRSASCRSRASAASRVIVNRPFREGDADPRGRARSRCRRGPAEIDCANWAQFLLKFIVSHPAVTCAIPATTQRRPRAGEHGRVLRPPARRGDAPAHRRARRASSDVRVVDVHALGLPALLAAHLLPALRALQRRDLAGAGRWRSSSGSSILVLMRRGVRGAADARRGDPRGLLALGRDRVSRPALRDDQWAAVYFAWAFGLEAALFLWIGVVAARSRLDWPSEPFAWAGMAICSCSRSSVEPADRAAPRPRMEGRRDLRRRARSDGRRHPRDSPPRARPRPRGPDGHPGALVRDHGRVSFAMEAPDLWVPPWRRRWRSWWRSPGAGPAAGKGVRRTEGTPHLPFCRRERQIGLKPRFTAIRRQLTRRESSNLIRVSFAARSMKLIAVRLFRIRQRRSRRLGYPAQTPGCRWSSGEEFDPRWRELILVGVLVGCA